MTVPQRTEGAGPQFNDEGMSPVEWGNEEDVRLIDRARRGAREAFGELYDRYVEAVYRYVAFRVRDDIEAEDVTSDVFTKALAAMPRYEPRGPFLAWLYRIARNAVVDRSRRRLRRVEARLTDPVAERAVATDPGSDPEWVSAAIERRSRLRSALSTLSRDQQDVIVLRYLAGLSTDEIVTVLQKPASTVRGIQMRALMRLRKRISPEELE